MAYSWPQWHRRKTLSQARLVQTLSAAFKCLLIVAAENHLFGGASHRTIHVRSFATSRRDICSPGQNVPTAPGLFSVHGKSPRRSDRRRLLASPSLLSMVSRTLAGSHDVTVFSLANRQADHLARLIHDLTSKTERFWSFLVSFGG